MFVFLLSAFALLLALLLFFWGLPRFEREFRNFYYNKIKWKNRVNRHQFVRIDAFFSSRFSYYRQLDIEGRAKFIYRTLYYIHNWDFESRQGLKIDQEKQLLVCGSAAQLTYGLRNFQIGHFHHIILYPDTFYSGLAEAQVKGLTYANGQVAFSWKDFEEGYRIDSDGYNLGLHEMAHALDVNLMNSNSNDVLLHLYFPDFIETAMPEFMKRYEEGTGFLRERATVNKNEFFAVCVENFFERPEDFKKNLPQIFDHLCLVLNQNPLNTLSNYTLEANFVETLNEQNETRLPNYFSRFKRIESSGSQFLFTVLIFPGALSYFQLIKINPNNLLLINILAIVGGILFVLFHSKNEIIKNRGEFASAIHTYNFIRGALLSVLVIFLINNGIWHLKAVNVYPLNEGHLECKGKHCRLKNLPLSDYSDDYSYLSTYQLNGELIGYYWENNIDVYLEERSDRGMFGLLNEVDNSILIGDRRFPARLPNY